MSTAAIARLRSIVIRFDDYKKDLYVYMREHLRRMSNMISELDEMDYELTDKQEVNVVIHSLPND